MASKRFRDAVGIDPDRIVAAAVDAAMGETRSRAKRHHPGRVLAAGAAVAAAAAVGQRRMPRLAKVPLRMGLRKLGDLTHVDELADALRDRLAGHEDEPDDDDDYYDEEDLDDEDYDDEDYDDEESDDEDYDDEEFDDEPRDEAEDEAGDDEDDEGFDDEDEDFDDEPEDDDGPRGEGDEEEPDDEPEDDSDEAGPEDDEPQDLEAEEDDEDLEPEDDDEDDEDDEQIAARSLDLGVASDANGRRSRDRVPDLFAALRTPHRRPPVMGRGSLRVDPATRPPEPGESHARDERRNRSRKSKSTAARA